MVEELLSERNGWLIFFPIGHLSDLMLPKSCGSTPEMPYRSPRILSSNSSFFYAGEKIFDPNTTGAYVFLFDWFFWSGFSPIVTANPALLRLQSVTKTSCFPVTVSFLASSQESIRASVIGSRKFPSILMSFWLELRLIKACRISQVFRRF